MPERFAPSESILKVVDVSHEIVDERLQQLAEFSFGADDELVPSEWVAKIVKHLGRSVTQDPTAFRREMVIVGALALAAVEGFDRRFPDA